MGQFQEDFIEQIIGSNDVDRLRAESLALAKDFDTLAEVVRSAPLDYCAVCGPTFKTFKSNICFFCGEDVGEGRDGLTGEDLDKLREVERIIESRIG